MLKFFCSSHYASSSPYVSRKTLWATKRLAQLKIRESSPCVPLEPSFVEDSDRGLVSPALPMNRTEKGASSPRPSPPKEERETATGFRASRQESLIRESS